MPLQENVDQAVASNLTNRLALESVVSPHNYYDHNAINQIIGYYVNDDSLLELTAGSEWFDKLSNKLLDFKKNADPDLLIIPIHSRDHFSGLYVTKDAKSEVSVYYFNPFGSNLEDRVGSYIPDEISRYLILLLGVDANEIIRTSNIFQSYHHAHTVDELKYILDNVHCGAFTSFILSELARGDYLRIIEGRLQINIDETWKELPNLNKKQSDKLGKAIRVRDRQLLSGAHITYEPIMILKEIVREHNKLQELGELPHYQLQRSASGMTQYTDLLDDILKDHDLSGFNSSDDEEYEEIDIKYQTPEKEQKKQEIKKRKKVVKEDAGKLPARDGESRQSRNARQTRHNKKLFEKDPIIKKLSEEMDGLDSDVEKDLNQEHLREKRMHLFRGKSLASKVIDEQTGELRLRTKKEVEDNITKQYSGKSLYSDGGARIRHDPSKLEKMRRVTKKFFEDIKDGEETTALFGAGRAYEAAVAKLMKKSDVKGNSVVATSKMSWIASEYTIGQMGGAAGGNRKVDYGYDAKKRPVHRVLGNAFAISLPLADYQQLRDDNDLIDVNVDLGKGVRVNQKIEEVTFNTCINGEYMRGALPVVLPRLDRDYNQMTAEKKKQYRKIFGLTKEKYQELQSKIAIAGVKLGGITEHIIQHHGSLLRKLAIRADRNIGYQGDFFLLKNKSYSGALKAMTDSGKSLSDRDARKSKLNIVSPHLECPVNEISKDEVGSRLIKTQLFQSPPEEFASTSESDEELEDAFADLTLDHPSPTGGK